MKGIVDIQIEMQLDAEKAEQLIDVGFANKLPRSEVIGNLLKIAEFKIVKIIKQAKEYTYQKQQS